MFKDVYSRKLVMGDVFESESSELAAKLLAKGCLREKTAGKPLVLHSDNGAAMKGVMMLATMQDLGVASSFSRPRVSNDIVLYPAWNAASLDLQFGRITRELAKPGAYPSRAKRKVLYDASLAACDSLDGVADPRQRALKVMQVVVTVVGEHGPSRHPITGLLYSNLEGSDTRPS